MAGIVRRAPDTGSASADTKTAGSTRRFHNFDAFRLLAATSVILSHCFAIGEGTEVSDPLAQLLGPGNQMGAYGVQVFFIMSGFLVARSVSRTESLKDLLLRRVLRIYPALTVCVLISAYLIAPFFIIKNQSDFITSWRSLGYVIHTLLMQPSGWIQDLHFYPREYGDNINGSLWTLQQEAQFYIAIVALAAIHLFRAWVAALFVLLGTAMLLSKPDTFGPGLENLIYALPAISSGVLTHFIVQSFGRSRLLLFVCLILMVLSAFLGVLVDTFALLAAYPLVFVGLSEKLQVGNPTHYGDLTYGTYLYGWPITQIWRSMLGEGHSGWLLFSITYPLALFCGFLSWHLIEKHMTMRRLTEKVIRIRSSLPGRGHRSSI